jgi:hypothetical protein
MEAVLKPTNPPEANQPEPGASDSFQDTLRAAAAAFEARKLGARQNSDGHWIVTLSIHPEDLPLWLMHARPGTRLQVGCIELNSDDQPDLPHDSETRKRAMVRAAILSKEYGFQEFLRRYDRWNLIAAGATPEERNEATAEVLRRCLGVASRREIATNREAFERFRALAKEYGNLVHLGQPAVAPPQPPSPWTA